MSTVSSPTSPPRTPRTPGSTPDTPETLSDEQLAELQWSAAAGVEQDALAAPAKEVAAAGGEDAPVKEVPPAAAGGEDYPHMPRNLVVDEAKGDLETIVKDWFTPERWSHLSDEQIKLLHAAQIMLDEFARRGQRKQTQTKLLEEINKLFEGKLNGASLNSTPPEGAMCAAGAMGDDDTCFCYEIHERFRGGKKGKKSKKGDGPSKSKKDDGASKSKKGDRPSKFLQDHPTIHRTVSEMKPGSKTVLYFQHIETDLLDSPTTCRISRKVLMALIIHLELYKFLDLNYVLQKECREFFNIQMKVGCWLNCDNDLCPAWLLFLWGMKHADCKDDAFRQFVTRMKGTLQVMGGTVYLPESQRKCPVNGSLLGKRKGESPGEPNAVDKRRKQEEAEKAVDENKAVEEKQPRQRDEESESENPEQNQRKRHKPDEQYGVEPSLLIISSGDECEGGDESGADLQQAGEEEIDLTLAQVPLTSADDFRMKLDLIEVMKGKLIVVNVINAGDQIVLFRDSKKKLTAAKLDHGTSADDLDQRLIRYKMASELIKLSSEKVRPYIFESRLEKLRAIVGGGSPLDLDITSVDSLRAGFHGTTKVEDFICLAENTHEYQAMMQRAFIIQSLAKSIQAKWSESDILMLAVASRPATVDKSTP